MKQKIVEKLKSTNSISSFAQLVANTFYRKNPDLFFLGLYLACAYSSGHLYVSVQEACFPSIEDLWGENFILDAEEISYIQDEIRKGSLLVRTMKEVIVDSTGRIFFERAYTHLIKVKNELIRICDKRRAAGVDITLESDLLQLVEEQQVTEEQSKALSGLLTNSISILHGGPGTGKTYTAGVFLKLYLSQIPQGEKEKVFIALSGPTGKATQNLKSSIQRALGAEFRAIENHVQAKTLHALLGVSSLGGTRQKEEYLPYQLIIIDEASMIDVAMMGEFLSRIKRGTKVIFLGDPNQLPPIDPGAIFAECVQKDIMPAFELTTCLRAEMQELVDFSRIVLRGTVQDVSLLFSKNEGKAVIFHDLEAYNNEDEYFIDRYKEMYGECSRKTAEESLFAMQSFRMLTPMKEGFFGIDRVNSMFQGEDLAARFTPILVTKNDYEYSLMNGQMGVLDRKNNLAYFLVEGKIIQLPSLLLPPTDLAWCLSVHKSQGSEFDHVVLFLPSGCEHFGKKMLYTAITRAKKKIEIYASVETLQKILRIDRELVCGLQK